jgi:sugar phosphate isomerase/epimerase
MKYAWTTSQPEDQWGFAVENCQRLGDYAAELGLQIALELEPFPLSLLNNVENMVRFIDDVGHDAVRANIDVSHLCLAHVPAEQLRSLKGKAIHVHISDCDGKVHGDLPPGRGVVSFEPYLREIAALGIVGSISIELEYSPEPDKIEAWVAEAYRETRRLMQLTGLATCAARS